MKSKKLLNEFENQVLEVQSGMSIFGGKSGDDTFCDTTTYDCRTEDECGYCDSQTDKTRCDACY